MTMAYLACLAVGFFVGFAFAFEVAAMLLAVKPEAKPAPVVDDDLAEDFA
jgi:hypothetical protein